MICRMYNSRTSNLEEDDWDEFDEFLDEDEIEQELTSKKKPNKKDYSDDE